MRDVEMAVVTINLKHDDPNWESHLQQLEAQGLKITEKDDNLSSVEGVIEMAKVHALEILPFVSYVRKQSHYYAEFPADDPRDQNKGLGSSPDDVPYMGNRRLGKRYP